MLWFKDRVGYCLPTSAHYGFGPGVTIGQFEILFEWVKVPDAAKQPEHIPTLESNCIPPPGKAEAEIGGGLPGPEPDITQKRTPLGYVPIKVAIGHIIMLNGSDISRIATTSEEDKS